MNVWCLSDLHLKSDKDPQSQALVSFLEEIFLTASPEDTLVLLGDIFDLWVGGHQVFYENYKKAVDAIAKLKTKGVRIIFIEGNHDLHIEPFWEKKIGAEVYVQAYYLNLPGLVVRLEHGDEINQEDKAYLRLRAFLRHPILKFLAQNLPGVFWKFIGTKASQTSRSVSQKSRSKEGQDQRMIGQIRAHVQRAYNEKPFDLIVSGHMHIFDDWSFSLDARGPGALVRSINLGSWLTEPYRILHLQKKESWVTVPFSLRTAK
jgi:UDP-2,3-diacylglucosamine hydrolase